MVAIKGRVRDLVAKVWNELCKENKHLDRWQFELSGA
jgi:hypothetical protein